MMPAGVTDCAEGPADVLVLALISTTLATANEPSAETSRLTIAGTPGPSLSVALLTAWFASIITTEPSSLRTASASTALASELFTSRMDAPGGDGNRCASS